MRKDSREAVMKLLYSYQLTGGFDARLADTVINETLKSEADRQFAASLLNAIKGRTAELATQITDYSIGFEYDRISYIDKSALMIALTEIDCFDDIPDVVSIDEAVALVKKYSTEQSLSFVNGILAEHLSRKNKSKV